MNKRTESLHAILSATRTLHDMINFMPVNGLTGNMAHEIQRIFEAVEDLENLD